jgi:hypothetical protein
MIPILLSLALTTTQPITVDRIEINAFPSGENRFTQVILYRWTRLSTGHGYHVADWWLVENDYMPPGRTISRMEGDRLYEFTAPSITYTLTDHDPELKDRKALPQDMRRSYITK